MSKCGEVASLRRRCVVRLLWGCFGVWEDLTCNSCGSLCQVRYFGGFGGLLGALIMVGCVGLEGP